MNRELPEEQVGFREGRGTRDQIANIQWMTKRAKEFQKKSTSCRGPALLIQGIRSRDGVSEDEDTIASIRY